MINEYTTIEGNQLYFPASQSLLETAALWLDVESARHKASIPTEYEFNELFDSTLNYLAAQDARFKNPDQIMPGVHNQSVAIPETMVFG